MRGHVPYHEIRVIRASHAHVAIVRKRNSVDTAEMPPQAAIKPEPLQCAGGGADPPAHRLVCDARTLLPPEKQVESERVVVAVLVWRRRRHGIEVGRGCLLHGLGWSLVRWWRSSAPSVAVFLAVRLRPRCRPATLLLLFLENVPWRTLLALQTRLCAPVCVVGRCGMVLVCGG
jgi:hypothetical protein